MRTVIVGASLAGLRAAQALRQHGYEGELIIVGDEHRPPYDRPPLSKKFLRGGLDDSDLALARPDTITALEATWLLGRSAVGLDVERRLLQFGDGDNIEWTGAVITTGAAARRPWHSHLDGIFTLRTIDDALHLRDHLRPGVRLTIVGGGFIGAEVAATAAELGVEVTVVEMTSKPFVRQLGATCAKLMLDVHLEHGVKVLAGTGVQRIRGDSSVSGVELSDGHVLTADAVLVGVGAVPNTEWLAGSAIRCSDGVLTDEHGRTNIAGVVAAGDVARYRSRRHGRPVRVEHWTNARDMPRAAGRALISHLHSHEVHDLPIHDPVPYVWSDQYDHHIQIAGQLDTTAEVVFLEGKTSERSFVAVQQRHGHTQAVIAWNSPKLFTKLRRELNKPHELA